MGTVRDLDHLDFKEKKKRIRRTKEGELR